MGVPLERLTAGAIATTTEAVVATCAAVVAALALATSVMAQSPVKETLAYSRETIPGIPPGGPGAPSGPGGAAPNPFPTTYFIYVVIERGTSVVATHACVLGKWYAAALKRVESPVMIERDPGLSTGEKETLVKRTSDDVYRVELQKPSAGACQHQSEEKKTHLREVMVYLQSGESKWLGRAEKIVSLRPARAM